MKRPIRKLVTSFALAAGLVFGAMPFAGAASANANATVTIGFTLEPVSLDITGVAGQAIPQVLLNNVYEGLLKVQPDGNIVPSLAKSYTVSKDGLTYTFELNKANFHSGSAMTAADVVWSLNRVIDPASAVLPAQKQQFASVASVVAQGPSKVVITLKARDNDFQFNLTQRGGVVFKTGTTDFATAANGTGPFTLKSWNRGSSITLERNDAYYGEKAKSKTVIFRYILDATALSNAILSGQIDIMSTVQAPELLAAFRGRKNLKVYSGTTAGEVTLSMNNAKAPFNDPKVRQAIRQAINKKALVKTAWAGYGLQIGSFVPPTDPWYENLASKYPFDVKKSRQLLAQAGYANGFDMTLDVPPAPYALASQEFIAASLAQVGIRVTLRPVAWAEWLDRVFAKANYDMSIVAHVERNDMAIYANPNYYFKFNNAQYQALVKQAAEERTQAARNNALRKAARILNDQHASDWLWLLPNLQVAKTSVTGFPLNAVGDAYSVADVVKK